MNKLPCPVCGNDESHESFFPKEMMFGKREVFEYLKCSNCGLLWLKDIPNDFSEYYPKGYFSFKEKHKYQLSKFRKYFDGKRVESELNNGLFHKITNLFVKRLDYLDWIKYGNLNKQSRIIDVGCGSGKLLQKMRLGGFENTEGADPFLAEDIYYPNGLVIYKKSLDDILDSLAYKYDLIMLHHSYEHMNDPISVMKKLSKMLSKNGILLIRIPLCDSLAWEMYHENWSNLDAPRHLFLHTKKSIQTIASKSGLMVDKIVYDSVINQFISSELYKNDLAGPDPKSAKDKILAKMDLNELKKLTAQVNNENNGDSAAFYLKLTA